ncbi:ABC transporter permease [Priestia taiwanensis]|uniref:ABC transporter permease n=1 Tax=Priestia taiwanensis TaxID=1347902 RepID=A0A917EP13_9BACI|nr:ABC transporter permease [Priestia taiwanensis]MBM7362781.1 simple sugar transport system permease protein [Priestia taiwanensis]GGE65039.1 ABC transporter permease [Priestia taiwanensis]
MNKDKVFAIIVPLVSIILGLVVGTIVMVLGGYDPVVGYQALLEGMIGSPSAIGETIRAMTPLILAGLSVAFAFRTGLFNIGVEGQLLVGWLAAVSVGILLDLPPLLHVVVAVLAAGIAGGIWGFVAGFLKGRFKVNEVIVTIMMNYIALFLTAELVRSKALYGGDEKTHTIKESASLSSEFLASLTDNSRMHWGIAIAIIMAIVVHVLLQKTTLGYELKAVGFNQHAAKYAGMNVKKNVFLSMTIAGFVAGIGGAMEGLGTFGDMTALAAFTGIGFDGIAVALLGANNPFGILFAAFLFGGLKNAGPAMNFTADVPSELVNIIIGCIVFFVASGYFIRYFLQRMTKGAK